MKLKLETGLKLGNSNSSPSFIRRGVTNAGLSSLGKDPVEREALTILVIMGSNKSNTSLQHMNWDPVGRTLRETG